MDPVAQFAFGGAVPITLGTNQPEYRPLPALLFPDGRVLTEWTFTEEERAAVARGENLRLWTLTFGQPFQPVSLQVTDEKIA